MSEVIGIKAWARGKQLPGMRGILKADSRHISMCAREIGIWRRHGINVSSISGLFVAGLGA